MPDLPPPGPRLESMRVHDWIKRAILDVAFRPGTALPEAAIASRFGLSRTPVREAILKLADEGWIDVRPQRGTWVARMSLERVEEALFVRQAVECALIERVAARADRGDVARSLAGIVDAQAHAIRAGDIGAALDADTRFHRALVEASGLPGVWDVVAHARDHHQRIRAIAVPELGSAAQAIKDHRAIVKALADGDAPRAQRAMREHLGRNLGLARSIAARHPDYFDGESIPAPRSSPGAGSGPGDRSYRARASTSRQRRSPSVPRSTKRSAS